MTNRLVEWCYTNESILPRLNIINWRDNTTNISATVPLSETCFTPLDSTSCNDFEKHGNSAYAILLYLSKPLNKTLKNQ